ncbi:hypothetical protein [Luteococcus peritonei]|uniref:DUF3558 domain-containing protein n=1 Tax=Luteococcus peritonei TaxID=88874 RepID=A0ABW4RSV9_9ACTN
MTPVTRPARAGLALLAPLAALAMLTGCSSEQEAAPKTTSTVSVPTGSASSEAAPGDGASSQEASPGAEVSTMDPAATGSASVESVADQATATASASSTVDTSGLKKAATAKLPAKVGHYTGQVSGDQTAQAGMYTGRTEDDMVMAALNTTSDGSKLIATLKAQTKTQHATCGSLQEVAYCVIPLDGGSITLNGTNQTKAADLGAMADQVYASLA